MATASQTPHQSKVIIIGAGFAGLSAATSLRQAGLGTSHEEDVVILEASNRVGGRARTLPLSNTLSVELGATWIHGIGTQVDPNPVLAAATSAGLMPRSPKKQRWWNSRFLLPERKEDLTKHEALVVHKAVEAFAAAIEDLENAPQSTAPKKKVVGEVLDEAWAQFKSTLGELSDSSSDASLAAVAWEWREKLQQAIDGCYSTHDLDIFARQQYSEYGHSEIHAPVPCGYQAIAESLASQVNVRLNHEVSGVEWSETGVLVTCSNGAVFEAEAAVITTSLGVLKARSEAMFKPALPERKQQAIERLEIGVVDKIIIDFATIEKEEVHAETTTNGSSSSSTSTGLLGGGKGELLEADGNVVTYSLLWDSIDLKLREDLPEWVTGIFSIRFGGPEFKRRREIDEQQELEQQQDLDHSAVPAVPTTDETLDICATEIGTAHGAGILENDEVGDKEESDESDDEDEIPSSGPPFYNQAVMWVTGTAAVEMESSSDDEVLSTVRSIVRLFPGVELPQGNESGWEGARVIRSRWGSDPLTAGSYSYVGRKSTIEDVAALKRPVTVRKGGNTIDKPVLLFAGEACHLQYIGTTHGAFLTGQEAAQFLLNEYKETWAPPGV